MSPSLISANSGFDTTSKFMSSLSRNKGETSSKITDETANGADSKAKRRDELGKNQFLKLLVTQMNNQSPLQPQANGEFIAQLAQFSTVEGIENLNKNVKALLDGGKASQALQGAALVGKNIIVSTDKTQVNTAEGTKGAVTIPNASANVWVNVYDPAGKLVNRLDLGQQPAGVSSFKWNGNDSSGKKLSSGMYRFEAQTTLKGVNTALKTDLSAKVESVTLGRNGSEMMVKVAGVGSIPLSKIQAIGQ
ncbi:flagellar basal-body rod modification protein FlgD [Pseudomonas psychrotolerans]|uniref:Basal-body rod modification protein FlgD n=2 Tax=Pseudomonas oryzihabitans TaxID=47885 RepID=A0AAJ2BMS5_9PSED|nr:flagellar hook assembly protein FlgD [Pseudomonas psychrotolerans]MDR6236898.1 flagellar basal-body rod modification protein FlgD [Pseudomonas psychrotolerans]MDR6353671.1 flagellar basal-body rod modification protein FlgD [Pseudomonas psychrotolerans]